VVATRQVTDTVKVVEDGWVGATIDRSSLALVVSPVVVPSRVVAALPDDLLAGFVRQAPYVDLVALVEVLREQCPLEFVPAPAPN
jgi:2-C-methyl-D-erythritol 4-phosphate cytidylyltransferase